MPSRPAEPPFGLRQLTVLKPTLNCTFGHAEELSDLALVDIFRRHRAGDL